MLYHPQGQEVKGFLTYILHTQSFIHNPLSCYLSIARSLYLILFSTVTTTVLVLTFIFLPMGIFSVTTYLVCLPPIRFSQPELHSTVRLVLKKKKFDHLPPGL